MYFIGRRTILAAIWQCVAFIVMFLGVTIVARTVDLNAQGKSTTFAIDEAKVDYGFPKTPMQFEYNQGLLGNWIDADGFGGGNCGSLKDERGNPRGTCQFPVDKLEPLLNERAKAWINFFDEPLSPRWTCMAANLTTALGEAYIWRFDFSSDAVLQHFEQSNWTRHIYVDGRPHPPMEQAFYHGHALGKMDGDVFVVETTNFTFDPDGFDDQSHIATSHLKRQIERYNVKGDIVEIAITIDDPLFLKKPYTWVQTSKRTDREATGEWFCDPEVGLHHLYSTAGQKYKDDVLYPIYKD
jgi:hypothetical protein